MRISLIALALALGAMLVMLAACSPASEESGEHNGGGEQSEQPGEHGEGGESGEHDGESGEGDGEESAQQYGLTDTYDVVRRGARLILSYDTEANAFIGTVENTTSETLPRVRIEVHLSNGIELGPTPSLDLPPGEISDVRLDASQEPFETWSAHPEVGGGDSAEQEDVTAPAGIETAARAFLANETGEDEAAFTLISAESVDWPDTSLGCPQEGFAYAQVITPGHKLIFTLGATSYPVHTNADGSSLILCKNN